MKFSNKKKLFLFLCVSILVASLYPAGFDRIQFEVADNPCPFSEGIFESGRKFIFLTDSNPSSQVLKLFNTFYYDREMDFEVPSFLEQNDFFAAEYDGNLYFDYYLKLRIVTDSDESRNDDSNAESAADSKSEDAVPVSAADEDASDAASGILCWLPAGNLEDILLSSVQVRKRVYAYCVLPDSAFVLKIPYWLCKADIHGENLYPEISEVTFIEDGSVLCSEESAYLTVTSGGKEKKLYLPKKLKFGKRVYTCAMGRRTKIRNPEKISKADFEKNFFAVQDNAALFSVKSEYKRIAAQSLEKLIQERNSIVYPPRFFFINLKEPSIYEKLEKIKLTDE